MVAIEQLLTMYNGGQWTMLDNGHWWTMYNSGQRTLVDDGQ